MRIESKQVPLYKYPFHIVIGDNDELDHWREENTDTERTPVGLGETMLVIWTMPLSCYSIVIYDREEDDLPMIYGMMAHEAAHLAMLTANDRGVNLDVNNQEPLTYMIEWITKEVITEYHKYLKDANRYKKAGKESNS